jgi:hypothetical protein
MTNPDGPEEQARTCPRCGKGELVDITYREGVTPADSNEEIQEPESRQVLTYSCGHEVVGPRLDRTAAGTDALEAERRTSEDTADPPDA